MWYIKSLLFIDFRQLRCCTNEIHICPLYPVIYGHACTWTEFFNACSNRAHYHASQNEGLFSKFAGKTRIFGKNTYNLSKDFIKSFCKSCKQLWNGDVRHEGFMKHSGKALISFATLITIGLTMNSIIRAKNMAKNKNKNT